MTSLTKEPFDLHRVSSALREDDRGIWRARSNRRVSYSEAHHDACYAVEARSFWFRHRTDCILEALRSHPPEGVILDIGGGNGFLTAAMANAGFDSILMEPGERGINNARHRGLQPLICSTLEEAGFPEHVIPAIGVFDVVEHVEYDEEFLALLNAQLIPHGKLYLTVPSFRSLWSSADDTAGHFWRYSLREIGSKLESAGFRILYSTYIFCLLPVPLFLLRTVPYRLGLSRDESDEQRQRHHGSGLGRLAGLVDRAFAWELGWIRRGRRIPFGASCLVVAAADS